MLQNRSKYRNSGFTLIELLIVIIIVGILVSIIGGSTISARRKAWDAQRKADMHELQTALELYFSENTEYPAQAGWQNTLVSQGYLGTELNAPGNAGEYTYTPAGTPPVSYVLTVNLENPNDSGPKIINGVFTLTQKQ